MNYTIPPDLLKNEMQPLTQSKAETLSSGFIRY